MSRTRIDGTWGVARDVSTGGMAITTQVALPLQSRVRVSFMLPGDRQVDATAEVVRSEGEDVGLRFLELSQDSLAALLAYVVSWDEAGENTPLQAVNDP